MATFIIQVATCAKHSARRNVDHARDRVEAEALTEEYQLIYGPSFRVTYKAAIGKGSRK